MRELEQQFPEPTWDEVKLEWKFNEGDKFYVEDVSTMKQKIEFMGKGFDQTLKTTMVTSYTVKQKTGDSVVLVQKIEDVDVKSMGGLGGGNQVDTVIRKARIFCPPLHAGEMRVCA